MAIAAIPFGKTGHTSSRLIFGAAALGSMSQSRADETLELVTAAGINHIDTAASYGDSELRLAPWLQDHRQSVFLATKTGSRTGSEARAELERSLERLGVDHVDLIQLHNLVEPDEWEIAHGDGGAVAALAQARSEGLVRFIGVTGHGTRIARMHMASLEEFEFDSVLLPWNFSMLAQPAYGADARALVSLCRQRGVAVQTIKSIALGRWPDGFTGTRFSWYEPLSDSAAIERAVDFVLSEPDLFLNTSSDATKLPMIIEAASRSVTSSRPSDDELINDVEAFGITPLFDGRGLERI